MNKYIVTVETNQGRERACRIGKQVLETGGAYSFEVINQSAAKAFKTEYEGYFPSAKYKVYKLVEDK